MQIVRALTSIFIVTIIALPQLFSVELTVAVAANFAEPLEVLASEFEARNGHRIIAVTGATGKLYTQIRQGAPFDVLLAADTKHAQLLEESGLAIKGSRFTYAIGKLVLYSQQAHYIDDSGKRLVQGQFKRLALANPEVAPYGLAAKEYLVTSGLWQNLQDKLVLGQDLGQAYQFVATGNAELGFVSLSQMRSKGKQRVGSYYEIPQRYYAPLAQQAVSLNAGKPAADFLQFLRGPVARKIIRSFGYAIP